MHVPSSYMHVPSSQIGIPKTSCLIVVFLTVCCQIDGMISVLDTSNYSILWTVPNNPYDVMGAWVPRNLSAHVNEGQWLSGIQHHITRN